MTLLTYFLNGHMRTAAALLLSVAALPAFAQNVNNGLTLYTTPQVSGQMSCSNGACHGPNPTFNQNRIKEGTDPANITLATNTNAEMFFLRGVLSASQLKDLAAYISNPSAANTTPIASLSSTTMGFGTVNIGNTSASQSVTLTNTGAGVLQLTALSSSNTEFALGGGTCTRTSALAATASCTIAAMFAPTATGVRSATITVAHNAGAGSSTISLAGTGNASVGVATTSLIEYYFAALDYYFITSHASDIALLDTVAGWQRTGKTIKVYATAGQAGTLGLNRYYFDQVAVNNTRGSHFYTLVQAEKDALQALNPNNTQTPRLPYNEGVDSYAFSPLIEGVGGTCNTGQTPVYRIFRGQARFPDNPNHRFTTDPALYNSFVALGWDGEGVKFCVPN